MSRPLSRISGNDFIRDVVKFRVGGCKLELESQGTAQMPMAVRSALTTPPTPPDVKMNVFGEQATLNTMKVRLLLQSL
ncbi:hypothetical protein [Sphingobium sp. D43FB]|uniref:hypothetical protein n=1 Tax=Sphingobium sp. D43FB TaxID=2017595 RepID=UPI0015969CE6|nr:hypothetical protein [Sphingobium sp. D43FB]